MTRIVTSEARTLPGIGASPKARRKKGVIVRRGTPNPLFGDGDDDLSVTVRTTAGRASVDDVIDAVPGAHVECLACDTLTFTGPPAACRTVLAALRGRRWLLTGEPVVVPTAERMDP